MSEEQTPIPIQIRLNSEKAIRQLVAGDPELEISIKKSIMENFAKSYEQVLIKSVNTAKIAELIQKQIEDSITTREKPKYGQSYAVLKPEIKKLVESAADDMVHDIINTQIRALREETNARIQSLINELNLKLDKALENMTDSITETVTSTAVEKIVEERVQLRLKAIKENL